MTRYRETQGLIASTWFVATLIAIAFVFFVVGLRHTSTTETGRVITSVGLFSWYQVPAPEGSTYAELRKRQRRNSVHWWRVGLTIAVCLGGLAALVPCCREVGRIIRSNRPPGDDCPACGYDMHAGRGRPCPECGWPKNTPARTSRRG